MMLIQPSIDALHYGKKMAIDNGQTINKKEVENHDWLHNGGRNIYG